MAQIINQQSGNYLLSYAGVPFVLDMASSVRMSQSPGYGESSDQLPPKKYQNLPDLIEQLDQMIPFQYLQDFSLPPIYPGKNLGAAAFQIQLGPFPDRTIKIGDFYYPNNAMRWSVFRGLATTSQVTAMQDALAELAIGANGNVAAPFIIQNKPSFASDIDLYTIETPMFMLPPRPLAEHGGDFDGLYLVTLIDERYYWQYNPIILRIDPDTTWLDLLSEIVDLLGIEANIPQEISSAYGKPEKDSQLWATMENAAFLLDSVAYNIGLDVVRNLDGTYDFLSTKDSQSRIDESRTATESIRTAGGLIDRNIDVVLPLSVSISFPMYCVGDDPVPHFINSRYNDQRSSCHYEDGLADRFTVEVFLEDLITGNSDLGIDADTSLQDYSGIPNSSHSIQDTAKALYLLEKDDTPLNEDQLTVLAFQLASDYYHGQIDPLDEVYPGIFAWEPEGIHDILWIYSAKQRQASTRVLRTQWNQMVREMQHGTPYPPFDETNSIYYPQTTNPRGVGGPSVAQTIKDSFSNKFSSISTAGGDTGEAPVSTTLDSDIAVDDFDFAVFTEVDYFPTDNRWKAQIGSEIILFEGTSGGIEEGDGYSVDFVARGQDGTKWQDHSAGDVINWIGPNVTYGVNLITYGQGQSIFPAEITSGGIQGVNIVPQTQSVWAFDGVTTDANGNKTTGGVVINGSRHYSGAVYSYDPTINNTGSVQPIAQWQEKDFIWLVERNEYETTSGALFDGQFLSYSKTSPNNGVTAPVYAVNANSAVQPGTGGGGPGGGSCGFPTYNDNQLATIPCCNASQAGSTPQTGPYPTGTISKMATGFGMNFISSTYNLSPPPLRLLAGTPSAVQTGATITSVSCTISPLPDGYYCHLSLDGTTYCSVQSELNLGDTGIAGPFLDETACGVYCSNFKPSFYCHRYPNDRTLNYCDTDPTQYVDQLVTGPYPDINTCQNVCFGNQIITEPGQVWFCHKTIGQAGPGTCSQDPVTYPDENIIGQYTSQADCLANCNFGQIIGPGGPTEPVNPYSPNPGMRIRTIRSQPNPKDPTQQNGNCTIDVIPTITYPPPSTMTSVNGNPINPGGGGTGPGSGSGGTGPGGSSPNGPLAQYPTNFVDSCSVKWTWYIDPYCQTIDIQANWTGLFVSTDAESDDPKDDGIDTLIFNEDDFKLTNEDGMCPNANGKGIQTNGMTGVISINYLDPDCVGHNLSISIEDGLVKSYSQS